METYGLATTSGHGHRGEENGGNDGQLHCDCLCLFSFEDKKDLKSCVDGRGKWKRAMGGVFIVIQRCCLLRRTSRNYSDYPDYVRILFYSGSPEIHRLFDDAFVWSGWDRSIHTYIALIDMDQYGHVTEYISVYSLCMYSVHCLYTPYSTLKYTLVYSVL